MYLSDILSEYLCFMQRHTSTPLYILKANIVVFPVHVFDKSSYKLLWRLHVASEPKHIFKCFDGIAYRIKNMLNIVVYKIKFCVFHTSVNVLPPLYYNVLFFVFIKNNLTTVSFQIETNLLGCGTPDREQCLVRAPHHILDIHKFLEV